MTLEDAIAIINSLMQHQLGRQLSDIETVIFQGAWQSKTYTQIADRAGYSVNYLTTDAGPKFWKALSQSLGESVNKKNFRSAIKRHKNQQQSSSIVNLSSESTSLKTDWGESPDVSQFYGRDEEQSILKRWILEQQCRLIAILGMGGIGKTTLSIKLGKSLQNQFDRIIWRSLRHAPNLSTLLEEIVPFLSQEHCSETDLPQLLHCLRNRRCLIILDNIETILKAGDRAGYYRQNYELYGDFFKLIGETMHQSCLIITSREKPIELATLEGLDGFVRSLQLSGSVETAHSLIQAKGLIGTIEQQQVLCDRYSYNPLALKIVSTTIQDLFAGEISQFLAEETIIFNSIRRLLDEQFQRLSNLEQSIMYWLAINREWTAIATLAEDIVPPVSRTRLIDALESLKWRGLIENNAGSYTQQPVVMEYVTECLIDQISNELVTTEFLFFANYPLIKTNVYDYIRDSQKQLILSQIADFFSTKFTSVAAIEQQILRILTKIRQSVSMQSSYAIGNLINLCNFLKIDLSHYDFSHLTIRHADFRGIFLKQVNFSGCHFIKSLFTETFGSLFSGTFSFDGNTLLTGDSTGNLRWWRVPEIQPIQTIHAHDSYIWSIALSPDRQYIATSSEDQTIKIWEFTTGNLVNTIMPESGAIRAIAWSKTGILASGSNDFIIRLWHPQNGECLKVLQGHQDTINTVSWNCDSTLLASAGNDRIIKIWHQETGTLLHTITEHNTPVRCVAWHPNQPLLASCSEDGEIKIFNLQTERWEASFSEHQNSVWCIVWNPDGKTLLSSSHDNTIRLWNAQTGECLRIFRGHTNWVWFTAIHPNQLILASGSHDNTLRLWDRQTGKCLKTLQGQQFAIRSLTWHPHHNLIAGGCDDTIIRLWQPNAEINFEHLSGHSNLISDVKWSPDGNYLASASHDRTIRVWHISTKQCLHILQGHTNWICSIAWHPNESILASCSVDRTIKIWNSETGTLKQTLPGHSNWVVAVDWYKTGKFLASGSADQTIRIWDINSGECVQILTGHQHWLWCISWSPDGKYLASGSYDRTVRIWSINPEITEGKSIICLHILSHPDVVSAIAWSPDSQIIATANNDAIIRLWCPQQGVCLKEFSGHKNQLLSIKFSPDGSQLISSSEDETIRIWDVQTGECLQIWKSDRPYQEMNISDITGLTNAEINTLKKLGAKKYC
ncbi:NB-ARC domain-containing protein [Aerosakkonemataceae cyanobacterium BLCC-F154]|uniref:NB-ARC domain-containing protein n=1 Tax=Floridaenema fluviatile BLCC-F154 TaxID=3153640 RepID=A0ABV4Y715_9CYAN